MASPALSEFIFKSCIDAIDKYHEGGEDHDKLLELSSWLAQFRRDGAITDAQLSALSNRLDVAVVVPDAPDTYEDTIEGVQQDISDILDGIAELGELVSEIIDPEEEE